jgi:microcystin-dependent protein
VFSMKNRGRLDKRTEEEFDSLYRRLRGLFSQTFDADGELIIADPNLAVTPVGGLMPFAGGTAPDGYRICDGSAVSRVTYQTLFNVIGTTWGVGDGSTTFNLPDLRQRFLLGKAASGTGNTLGATGGTIDHTHTGSAHTHTVPAHSHGVSGGTTADGDHAHTVDSHTHDVGNHTHTYSGSTQEADPDGVGLNVAVSAGGGHTHQFSGTTSSSGAGTSTAATPGTTSAGSHSHTLSGAATDSSGSGTTGSSGGGTTSTANPPYAVVNYLIFAGV